MAHAPNDDGMISAINVTPLVDVVLVLLVILMVTAQFVAQQTLPIELPSAGTGESTPHTASISVDERRALYLDGEAIAEDALRARLSALRRDDPELQAVIAADGRVDYQRVVDVMDLLRGLGITRFAFNVDPTER